MYVHVKVVVGLLLREELKVPHGEVVDALHHPGVVILHLQLPVGIRIHREVDETTGCGGGVAVNVERVSVVVIHAAGPHALRGSGGGAGPPAVVAGTLP